MRNLNSHLTQERKLVRFEKSSARVHEHQVSYAIDQVIHAFSDFLCRLRKPRITTISYISLFVKLKKSIPI